MNTLRDIKGREFKIGDKYIDWCTGIPGEHEGKIFVVDDMAELDHHYVISWGFLEIINEKLYDS